MTEYERGFNDCKEKMMEELKKAIKRSDYMIEDYNKKAEFCGEVNRLYAITVEDTANYFKRAMARALYADKIEKAKDRFIHLSSDYCSDESKENQIVAWHCDFEDIIYQLFIEDEIRKDEE